MQVLGGMDTHASSQAATARMLTGNLCLVGNTLAMALYFLTAKALVTKYPPACLAAWAYVSGSVAMGATALATTDYSEWTLAQPLWGPLLYWVVVCSVVGYFVVTWATQHLPASQVCAARGGQGSAWRLCVTFLMFHHAGVSFPPLHLVCALQGLLEFCVHCWLA